MRQAVWVLLLQNILAEEFERPTAKLLLAQAELFEIAPAPVWTLGHTTGMAYSVGQSCNTGTVSNLKPASANCLRRSSESGSASVMS